MSSLRYPIYFISDRTGITLETLGRGVLSQFPDVEFDVEIHRFIDNAQKLHVICDAIKTKCQRTTPIPVVYCSLVDVQLRQQLEQTGARVYDVLQQCVNDLEQVWPITAVPTVGQSHGVGKGDTYHRRIDAINFALNCDDGARTPQYEQADIILLGVSRSGKTPTALYLAMHYGVFVANYPLVEEELLLGVLPEILRQHRQKLYGLNISAHRLVEIRQQRRPGSTYASLTQCERETRQVTAMFLQEHIESVDVTQRSVEEVAGHILAHRPQLVARST